jgi:hypothetical protein
MVKIAYCIASLAMLFTNALLLFSSLTDGPSLASTLAAQSSVTLWLQATDSCERALPGASFSLVNASGQATVAPETQGIAPVTIGNARGACPLSRGSCVQQVVGCTSWQIPVPNAGTVTYRIVENATPAMANGLVFPENPTGPGGRALLGFVPCTGGAACHSESATVTVNSSGATSAVVNNVSPDRTVQTYGPFAGTRTDPVLFHNYGVGSDYASDPCIASAGNVQMNYGTGTQSSHCRYVP